ncbi:hypothetical protein D4764_06G0005230 [Takifugu flavidus]|uniref:Ig-like domain-containing protein n=1 Tax=Takifugu flavidus TaxID=433684 RepID=A0A5C6MVJ2_9TELE|nr:hypothetical protein D4764_06G0005230 [Takifugu flavidus]
MVQIGSNQVDRSVVTDLTKDDKTSYCCNEKPENCHEDHIQLTVTALQVKVFPTTDGQTVTLMCSTACTLTDRPAAYIWYRNSELLYQDRSPWYQEMVTSDKTVRYSCAIKGYEALRAPAVTVGGTATKTSPTRTDRRLHTKAQSPLTPQARAVHGTAPPVVDRKHLPAWQAPMRKHHEETLELKTEGMKQ